jgi:hypothetical protein
MDIVQKPFQAEGVIRRHGEVVDAGSWKHGARLREQRYLAPFAGEPVTCELCGRMFAGEANLGYHIKVDHPDDIKKQSRRERAAS